MTSFDYLQLPESLASFSLRFRVQIRAIRHSTYLPSKILQKHRLLFLLGRQKFLPLILRVL